MSDPVADAVRAAMGQSNVVSIYKEVIAPRAALCSACQGPVYADIWHGCGQPYRLGGPEGQLCHVTEPPLAASGGWFSEAPDVNVTQSRTHCSACKEPLQADVRHVCEGNARWHS